MNVGFVTLFGRSNVGKSTLLNALVGTKVAITTPKPQTTRHQIQGVVHRDDAQIVFVDTPGIFTSAKTKLTSQLNKTAQQSLNNIDVIVHVVDPTRAVGPEDKKIFSILEPLKQPKILVINKTDLRNAPYTKTFESYAEDYDAVIHLSAKTGQHVGSLINVILEHLPEGEPVYPKDQLTNSDNTFRLEELIREKLFLRLREELPYSLTVKVDEVETRENGVLYVQARILTSSKRYQGMIIGKGGRGIREIGQAARKELESVTDQKVFLDLNVEVDPHWVEAFL